MKATGCSPVLLEKPSLSASLNHLNTKKWFGPDSKSKRQLKAITVFLIFCGSDAGWEKQSSKLQMWATVSIVTKSNIFVLFLKEALRMSLSQNAKSSDFRRKEEESEALVSLLLFGIKIQQIVLIERNISVYLVWKCIHIWLFPRSSSLSLNCQSDSGQWYTEHNNNTGYSMEQVQPHS